MAKIGDKNGESVGIDIGAYSIKIVALKDAAEKKFLSAYNIKKIPHGMGVSEIEPLVKEALEEIDLSPSQINLSISGPDVIVRFVNFPKMSREQLDDALVYEAEKYIPFNISEVVTDFIFLGDATEPGQMQVILAAAKRPAIENLTKIFENLKISVGIMDTDPFAMFNAFTAVKSSLEKKPYTLFNFGHSRTDILISFAEVPSFIRQVQIGGKNITDAICRDLSVEQDAAEEFKLGIDGEKKEQVMKATIPVLDELSREIQHSFSYFETRHDEGRGDIYCSGGMIEQAGVVEYLNEKLKIQMKKWNPLEGVEFSEDLAREDVNSVASQLAVCTGLALRKT